MPIQVDIRDDGIVQITLNGYVDAKDVADYLEEYAQLLETATEEDPLRFLVSSARLAKFSSAARKAMAEALQDRDPRVGRSAMVGTSPYFRVLVGFILKATGRDDVRLFALLDEALDWLGSEG